MMRLRAQKLSAISLAKKFDTVAFPRSEIANTTDFLHIYLFYTCNVCNKGFWKKVDLELRLLYNEEVVLKAPRINNLYSFAP